MFTERESVQREMESVCREREGVCFEIERGSVWRDREGMGVEREIEVEIECVQNDRNVYE